MPGLNEKKKRKFVHLFDRHFFVFLVDAYIFLPKKFLFFILFIDHRF